MSLVFTIIVSVYHSFVMCGIFRRGFKRDLSSSLLRLSRYTIPKIHRTLTNHGFHSYKAIRATALERFSNDCRKNQNQSNYSDQSQQEQTAL